MQVSTVVEVRKYRHCTVHSDNGTRFIGVQIKYCIMIDFPVILNFKNNFFDGDGGWWWWWWVVVM